MEEAERVALQEHGSYKLAVISGVGTRDYYRKLGYELEGPYMSKMLTRGKERFKLHTVNVALEPKSHPIVRLRFERVLGNIAPLFSAKTCFS